MSLYLEADYLGLIKKILKIHFDGFIVYAYGPRVSGVNLTPETELNIAIVSDKPISVEKMVAIETAFSEKSFPFSIDVVDWVKLPESMQKQIKREHLVIQDGDFEL
ncbi:MAG: nucleotidyltransferase domain-containing protein [Fibrobacter sp.]|jgi:hypothetical protein|nr:nucleotidyltransferase domain-containing protein [Fibrobacter sp.]